MLSCSQRLSRQPFSESKAIVDDGNLCLTSRDNDLAGPTVTFIEFRNMPPVWLSTLWLLVLVKEYRLYSHS